MCKLVVFTGAGISAPSGIPTFRTDNGLWENHRIEDVCTVAALVNNAEGVRSFYNDRRKALETVHPNPAHAFVNDMVNEYNGSLITTNVDDLHDRNAPVNGVMHVHGELTKLKCTRCSAKMDIGYEEQTGHEKCPSCGSDMRIDIVVFGDSAPMYSAMSSVMFELTSSDVLLVIGTTGSVIPVDEWFLAPLSTPPLSILCNKDQQEMPDGTMSLGLASGRDLFDHVIFGDVVDNLPKIRELIKKKLG